MHRHQLDRRMVLGGMVGTATLGLTGAAMAFPERPITIIVPYAPGSTDNFARALGTDLEPLIGQKFVVETKPGAGGVVGAQFVAKSSRADGHTLLFATSAPLSVAPYQNDLVYQPSDLRPVARIGLGPNVLGARVDAPFKDLKGLVAYAKANPGKVTFGSAGIGSSTHLAGEAFADAAGIELLHVPYPGVTPAVAATMGGQIDLTIGFAQALIPPAKAGRMVPIAQFGSKRAKILPDVPTFMENGVSFTMDTLVGIWAPKDTPDAVVAQLASAIEKAANGQSVQTFAQNTMTEVAFAGPEAFGKEVETESKVMKPLLDKLKLSKSTAK